MVASISAGRRIFLPSWETESSFAVGKSRPGRRPAAACQPVFTGKRCVASGTEEKDTVSVVVITHHKD